MKMILLSAVLMYSTGVMAEPLTEIKSPIFYAAGSQSEITQRGSYCLERYVRFDAVHRAAKMTGPPGNGAPIGIYVPALKMPAESVVLEQSDGLVIAQIRTHISTYNERQSVQSKINFEAKDGRFRLSFYNIGTLNVESGRATNYRDVPRDSKAAHGIKKAFAKLSESISQCVQTESVESW